MLRAKVARILSGDDHHEDHWLDVEGYAKMSRDFLRRTRDLDPNSNCTECGGPKR